MSAERDAPPLPGRAIIEQRWSEAVFVHWRVDPALVDPLLPEGTRPDVFDGSAWVGLVPFRLSRFRFLPFPPVPLLGSFVEINVRTYAIDAQGRRGVVFRTLEAEHLLPVLAAQALFGLPYRWARAGSREEGDVIAYRSQRHGLRGEQRPGTRLRVARSTSPVDTPLSRFLTARWGFHERHLGRTVWASNSHEPWPLVEADLLSLDDDLVADSGFPGLAHRTPDSVLAMPSGHPGFLTRFAAPERA
ncbi:MULTISPECIES: YqjF family protein [unclassified Microbacterium]|uniref:YqjF family protein n=1 Tax=unclassified Microbacterium TaxID=2609290 RepID=UPI00374571BD